MYLMYVDESGDPGIINSPSRYFILSGLVVHELRWRACLKQLIAFRRRMKQNHGLKVREEIHAGAFLSRPGQEISLIPLHQRVAILRALISELAGMAELSVINIAVDKHGKSADFDAFEVAWRLLIQRFESGIISHNLHGPSNADERGILLPDNTSSTQVTRLLRAMRRRNPIPHTGNQPVQFIVEDPCFRDSQASYFVQAADLVSYVLCQKTIPNSKAKRHGIHNLFDRLDPVLYTHASSNDPQGVVRM